MNNNIPKLYEVVHREIFSYSVLFLIFACLYSKSKVVKPLNTFLSAKFFYPIAQVSYSAYLFHEMFMFWFFPKFVIFSSGFLSNFQIVIFNSVISFVAIILFATLMYLLIEQPFQDIKESMKNSRLKSKERELLKV